MKSRDLFKEFEKRAKNTALSKVKPERLGPPVPRQEAKTQNFGQRGVSVGSDPEIDGSPYYGIDRSVETERDNKDLVWSGGDYIMTANDRQGPGLADLVNRLKENIARAMNIPVEYLKAPPALRPAMNERDQYRAYMGLNPFGQDPGDPRDRQIEDAKRAIERYEQLLKKLGAAAHTMATVVDIRGDRMTIVAGAQHFDVALFSGAKVGDVVALVAESMQVLHVIPGVQPQGIVATVQDKLPDGQVEVDYGGRRAARSAIACDAGDRVLLDASLSVVLQNLGKPKSVLAYEKATGTTWDDIGGHDDAKRILRDAIETPKLHPELFAAYVRRPTKGVCLYGPPGTGKTLLARAAATSLAKTHGHDVSPGFIYVKGPALLSKWVGESEATVRAIFAAAREHQRVHGYPALVFIDEAEAVLGKRGREHGNVLTQTMVPQFLAEMDGLEDSGALVLLATNRPGDLDPAVLREGRIDRKVLVGRPKREDTARIAAIHLRSRPAADGVTLAELAEEVTESVHACEIGSVNVREHRVPIYLASFSSGAMIAGIVENASESALARDVVSGQFSGITREDIKAGWRRACDGLVGIDPIETAMEILQANPEMLAAAKETQPSVTIGLPN